ncbi:hypothetical protein CYMTET_20871, partial [Cymbomonas tetramitiformis]
MARVAQPTRCSKQWEHATGRPGHALRQQAVGHDEVDTASPHDSDWGMTRVFIDANSLTVKSLLGGVTRLEDTSRFLFASHLLKLDLIKYL